jgi:hypothetical protein
LILAQEQAEELLEDINRLCSKGERDFIQESLKSKAIPSPKLIIKDHKKKDKWGNFTSRLVIPATNFTSSFPKLGYMGIKKIFDDEKVNYMKKAIVQASHAKGTLEQLFINKSSHTVFSLDIESFFPSVTYSLVEMVTSFVLENTAQVFNEAVFDGIYRDDGLVVFKGSWSKQEITKWLDDFQAKVNKITKHDGLQFTVSIWGAGKEDGTTHEKVAVEPTDYLAPS